MAPDQRIIFEAWMKTHGDAVLRLCWMCLRDRAMAEDALQETFLRVWQAMDRFVPESDAHVRAWICRIALNVCRDVQRSRWWRHIDSRLSLDDLPEPAVPVSEASRELFLLVAALPDRLRLPVVLRCEYGMTEAEAARALGISRPTLHKRFREACRRLAVAWKEDEG